MPRLEQLEPVQVAAVSRTRLGTPDCVSAIRACWRSAKRAAPGIKSGRGPFARKARKSEEDVCRYI